MALDPHPAPSGEARHASAERLKGALDQLAHKAKHVADEEFDAAVDEAIESYSPPADMRVVLDTNILARATPRSKGVARTLLLTILESAEHVLVLSPFLLREIERVLSYPRLQAIWPRTPVESEQYTQALEDFAELVNPPVQRRVVPDDQEDDPVLDSVGWARAGSVHLGPPLPSPRGSQTLSGTWYSSSDGR